MNSKLSLDQFIFLKFKSINENKDFQDYLFYKILTFENPDYISINLQLFEKYILLPLYNKIVVNSRKRVEKLNYIFKKYQKIINNACEKYDVIKEIAPYGSFTNTFLDEEGDIDICIVPTIPWFEFRPYANKIMNKIKNKNIGRIKLFHKAKSFFLISIYDKETKIELDITIHNILPILNSKLIKIYSQYDQRFHIMGIYLKYWSKNNKIHGAAYSYLSSYALLNMLIYFLQKVIEPRVLPNLQKIPKNDDFNEPKYKNEIYEYYEGKKERETNIFYEDNFEKIDKYMMFINKGEKNKESVSNLLLKFFEYYSYFYDGKTKISIKKNKEEESSLNKSSKIAFSIDDPFESKHNPGKSMKINTIQYNKFTYCMKKEILNILSGEYIKKLTHTFSEKKI